MASLVHICPSNELRDQHIDASASTAALFSSQFTIAPAPSTIPSCSNDLAAAMWMSDWSSKTHTQIESPSTLNIGREKLLNFSPQQQDLHAEQFMKAALMSNNMLAQRDSLYEMIRTVANHGWEGVNQSLSSSELESLVKSGTLAYDHQTNSNSLEMSSILHAYNIYGDLSQASIDHCQSDCYEDAPKGKLSRSSSFSPRDAGAALMHANTTANHKRNIHRANSCPNSAATICSDSPDYNTPASNDLKTKAMATADDQSRKAELSDEETVVPNCLQAAGSDHQGWDHQGDNRRSYNVINSKAKSRKRERLDNCSRLLKAALVDSLPDVVHVRARRGQATDSHSLAERVRREKISQRMKVLQEIVPGCHKVLGKAMMLDEIINYVKSLQKQVEFLSMKLAAANQAGMESMTMMNKDNAFVNEVLQNFVGFSLPCGDVGLNFVEESYQLRPAKARRPHAL